ncbi:MAG: glycosyltransferase family 2 protein [Deltaproteobacteria bacterium]|nr:glycosyltransferase family 2 protein [Deltaproteobacteria bacterium]
MALNLALTIIIPLYNEEESLVKLGAEMDAFLNQLQPDCGRVLFVNDGSSDGSLKIIEDICRQDERYAFISLDRNHGLSTAIKAGIDHCRTPLVGYIDADMQTIPADFGKFLQFLPEYDMVNGIRAKRQDSIIKKISSKIANSLRRLLINDRIVDTCCPLKIIKLEYAQKIPFFTGMHRFLPALVQLQHGRVKQVPVSHFPRFAGTAKYNLWNRLLGPFFDLLAFIWMRRRYINYRISQQSK